MPLLDGHAHCGLTLPLSKIKPRWQAADITGGVIFSPVEEIYDRYDQNFTDSTAYRASREKVHAYLETLITEHLFAFWFVWNDFVLPPPAFKGIKWHRHADEPPYDYDHSRCEAFIAHICARRLPVIFEEEFDHTLKFIKRLEGQTPVIIPHCGALNGGYMRLKQAGLFENPAVYVDTALASTREISDFAETFGVDRIIFGSDFPFGEPARELAKVEKIFSSTDREKVLGQNILRLINEVQE